MAHTGTMNVTFHRAFDRCSHPEQAIDKIFELGFKQDTYLWSTAHSCTRNTSVTPIERAISRENRHYGWLRSERREQLLKSRKRQRLLPFHFSAREPQPSKMKNFNNNVYMGNNDVCEDVIMLAPKEE